MSVGMEGAGYEKAVDLKEDLMETDRSGSPSPESQLVGDPEGYLEDRAAGVAVVAPTMEAVLDENEKLKRRLKRAKAIFGKDWDATIKHWKWRKEQAKLKRKALAELQLEAVVLEITLAGVKLSVNQVGEQLREKEALAGILTRRVAKLKEGAEEDDLVSVVPGVAWKSAVAVFPEEVWNMIFGYLTDMKDLVNCSNASPLFHEILLPTTSVWLLESALPHLYRHLPGNKLLEFRLVSKGWKKVIDSFLENHPSLQPHSMDSDPRRLDFVYPVKQLGICGKNEFRFALGQDLSILEGPYFQSMSNQNPFIGRYLGLNIREPGNRKEEVEASNEPWWNRLYQFLHSFGEEVWYLTLTYPCPWEADGWNPQRLIQFLTVELFQFLPNLRKLNFKFVDGCDYDFDHARVNRRPQFRMVLPSLETFECTHDFNDPEPIRRAFLQRYNSQLRKLHLRGEVWDRVSRLDWPNLVELHVVWYLYEDYFRSFRGMRTPNLTKLTLEITMFDWLDTLMDLINELANTTRLKTLSLVGEPPELKLGAGGCRPLELAPGQPQRNLFAPPTLTTLEIVDPNTNRPFAPSCYDFLLRFPFLENINLLYKKYGDFPFLSSEICLEAPSELPFLKGIRSDNYYEKVVHLNQYLLGGEMYKSNVWELLPRLKVFTFQWDVYDRAGYEAYERKHGGVAGN